MFTLLVLRNAALPVDAEIIYYCYVKFASFPSTKLNLFGKKHRLPERPKPIFIYSDRYIKTKKN
jgi:hypothetical protein